MSVRSMRPSPLATFGADDEVDVRRHDRGDGAVHAKGRAQHQDRSWVSGFACTLAGVVRELEFRDRRLQIGRRVHWCGM